MIKKKLGIKVGVSVLVLGTIFAGVKSFALDKHNVNLSTQAKQLVSADLEVLTSIERAEKPYNYVVKPTLKGEAIENIDGLKYIVVHETDDYRADATAENLYRYLYQYNNARYNWIIDDENVISALDINIQQLSINERSMGNSDIKNNNSLSVLICTNEDGDYTKTVGNTVCKIREVLQEYPGLKIVKHSEAKDEQFDGEAVSKQCPKILMSEETWWTWDRFVFFAIHPELPVPFVDFNPEADEYKDVLKYLGII